MSSRDPELVTDVRCSYAVIKHNFLGRRLSSCCLAACPGRRPIAERIPNIESASSRVGGSFDALSAWRRLFLVRAELWVRDRRGQPHAVLDRNVARQPRPAGWLGKILPVEAPATGVSRCACCASPIPREARRSTPIRRPHSRNGHDEIAPPTTRRSRAARQKAPVLRALGLRRRRNGDGVRVSACGAAALRHFGVRGPCACIRRAREGADRLDRSDHSDHTCG